MRFGEILHPVQRHYQIGLSHDVMICLAWKFKNVKISSNRNNVVYNDVYKTNLIGIKKSHHVTKVGLLQILRGTADQRKR